MGKMFDQPQSFRNIRFVSHRGFQPMAPANSLAGFEYAAWLRQWAIETDVHFTRDGVAVCCHDASVQTTYNGSGRIADMSWAELSELQINRGTRLECLQASQKRMPLFSEYLAICKRYGSIPFIELKTEDADCVVSEVRKAGFDEEEVIMSSSSLDWLIRSRKAAPKMFIHWIFGNEDRLNELASLGNAGMSWKIDDPLARPYEKIKLAHDAGLKVCLRAADQVESVQCMLQLGLDYLPTNCMHNSLTKENFS